MGPAVALPHLPLVRLRASRSDWLRSLLERLPALLHATPTATVISGDRGVANYRSAPGCFFLQVHWRWTGEGWDEREVVVVPGATVALRLVLDDIDPAAISRALELAPSRAFGKQDRGKGAVAAEGLWIHEVWPLGYQFAEEKVAELVAVLRARPRFREVLAQPGVTWAGITVKLRGCVERAGGFALEPALLADLAGLSLALDLDLGVE